jgi:hypothetical protein
MMAAPTGGTPKTIVVHAQQRWEYVIVNRRSDVTLAEELNALGQRGWELVSATNYRDTKGNLAWSAFLKRPTSAQPAAASEQDSTGSSILGSGATGVFGSSSSSIISGDSGTIGTDSAPKEVKIDKSTDVRPQRRPSEP